MANRGGLKPGEPGTYSTDTSNAFEYIEDLRFPKYVPIKVKFPLVEDRKAANIDYTSETWHRSFRGKVPFEYYPYDGLKLQPPKNFASSQYLFINSVPNGSHIPEGYYATSSGLAPIDFIPFTQGDTTDHPTVIDGISDNEINSNEFIIARNTPYSGGLEHKYISSYNPSVGRFEWEILPKYQAPVEPDVRFPNGAIKKKTFK